MRGGWENKRIRDAGRLLRWLLDQGGADGVEVTRAEMAAAMDWPVVRVDTIIQWLRERPELGFAVSMRHGSVPWVVVSTPESRIGVNAMRDESQISKDNVLEALWRLTRQVSPEFMHAAHVAEAAKGTNEHRTASGRKKEHMRLLMAIQGMLDRDREEEAELWAFIDEVLDAA